MGKYTQTLFEYMESIDLDPFDERDLIEAGRSLLKVEYNVPEEAMDMLLQRFVVSYINNEVAFTNINRFKMELMKYAIQRRPWYERMYGLFDEVLPDEFVEQIRQRELSEDEERQLIRELKRELEGKLHGNHVGNTNYNSILSNIDKERVNNTNTGSRDELRKVDDTRNDTTRRSGGVNTSHREVDATKEASNRFNQNVYNDTKRADNVTTDRKTGNDKTDRRSRDANGFGSINNYAEPGIMVNDSTITDGVDTIRYDSSNRRIEDHDETLTHREQESDNSRKSSANVKSGDEFTNRNETDTSNIKGNETEDRNVTTSDTTVKDGTLSSESTNRNSTKTNRLNDEMRNDVTNEDTAQLNESNKLLKELEMIRGNNSWKMQLLREFYDLYIVIDDEWVRGARDLFSYIY